MPSDALTGLRDTACKTQRHVQKCLPTRLHEAADEGAPGCQGPILGQRAGAAGDVRKRSSSSVGAQCGACKAAEMALRGGSRMNMGLGLSLPPLRETTRGAALIAG